MWSRLDDTWVNCFIPGENYLVSKGKASSVELWESDTFCQVARSPPRSFRSHGGIPAASAWAILIRYISDTKGKGGMLITISLHVPKKETCPSEIATLQEREINTLILDSGLD